VNAAPVDLDALRFDERGLIPVVVQDAENGDVLMLAWANREALERTLAEGRMVYWSRSRKELWRKGDTSGHVQHLVELRVDCDEDVLLARVHQEGAACHTGERSCFFRRLGV
jgi:phosphoribosyl-AMP cyclohydrolase